MVEKVLDLNREKTIFWTLLGVLIFSALFYIYCINITIHNTVARQNFEAESSSLALKIGSKEFQYISKRNNVTLALAYSMGFKDSKPLAYLSRNSDSSVAFLSR
ncbi:MAG TPA: hypothetical protein VGC58_00630 [Candidatus Paceibacterota bacterium]